MQFMDLTVNNTLIFTNQICENLVAIQRAHYLSYVGFFAFLDTQGNMSPEYTGLNTRWLFFYGSTDGVTLLQIPLQATPNQQLACILDGQNCVITLREQPIDTALLDGTALPVGADEGYIAQSLLAPYTSYGDPSYAGNYFV